MSQSRYIFMGLLLVACASCAIVLLSRLLLWRTANQPLSGLYCDSPHWDFGTVETDSGVLQHRFLIENRGPRSVALSRVQKGCNCLNVSVPEQIEAGQSILVNVSIEKRSRQGPFVTHVTLVPVDGSSPVELTVRFSGQPRVSVVPAVLHWSGANPLATVEAKFEVIQYVKCTDTPPEPYEFKAASERTVAQRINERTRGFDSRSSMDRVVDYYIVNISPAHTASDASTTFADRLMVRGELAHPDATLEVPITVDYRRHSWLTGPTTLMLHVRHGEAQAALRLWSVDRRKFCIADCSTSVPLLSEAESSEPSSAQAIRISCRAEHLTGWSTGILTVRAVESPQEPYTVTVHLIQDALALDSVTSAAQD